MTALLSAAALACASAAAPEPGGLLAAVRAGSLPEVETLLEAGADPKAQDVAGQDPLMLAALLGDPDIVERLLARGANAWAACYNKGFTALMLAAGRGHAEVVIMLLAWGAPLDATNKAGDSALMLAANNGRAEVVRALLAAGATATRRNRAGETARAMAASNGHAETSALLPADPPPPPPAKRLVRKAGPRRQAATKRRRG